MSPTDPTIAINGAALSADPSGALYWASERTLIVADLHLGKGSGYAARGTHLPPYDTRATLDRLAAVLADRRPDRVICLGDSFHDADAAARLHGEDADRLSGLTNRHDWIWVAGNHDPAPPPDFGGRIEEEISVGPIAFRHEARSDARPGEISGHFHPKACCKVRGRRLSERCFIADATRLILPAFGAYTGGLDVFDPAIHGLFRRGFHVWMLGARRVHRLPRARLCPG